MSKRCPNLRARISFLTPWWLRAGQSAAVEVPFCAAPQPRVRWSFEGLTLHESRRIRVDTVYNMTSLVITKAEKSDAGTYSLHLDNPFGSANLNIRVIVLGETIFSAFVTTHRCAINGNREMCSTNKSNAFVFKN